MMKTIINKVTILLAFMLFLYTNNTVMANNVESDSTKVTEVRPIINYYYRTTYNITKDSVLASKVDSLGDILSSQNANVSEEKDSIFMHLLEIRNSNVAANNKMAIFSWILALISLIILVILFLTIKIIRKGNVETLIAELRDDISERASNPKMEICSHLNNLNTRIGEIETLVIKNQEENQVHYESLRESIESSSRILSNLSADLFSNKEAISNEIKELAARIDNTGENVIDVPVVSVPTLDAYNQSVFTFSKINDHIASLRRRQNNRYLLPVFKYLANMESDKKSLAEIIRSSEMADQDKIQFIAIVDDITNFLANEKQTIDAWLGANPKEGITSYEEAVRIPIGLKFEDTFDRDIMGEDAEGKPIDMIYKLGFYFPGSTVKAYREKTVVSVID